MSVYMLLWSVYLFVLFVYLFIYLFIYDRMVIINCGIVHSTYCMLHSYRFSPKKLSEANLFAFRRIKEAGHTAVCPSILC